MTSDKDKIYGSKDLAKFFGVTEKTIWEWCKHGRLPAFKIGKEWKVRVVDLQKMINQKIRVKSKEQRESDQAFLISNG